MTVVGRIFGINVCKTRKMAATQRGICVPSRHLVYRTEKYHDNLDRVAL